MSTILKKNQNPCFDGCDFVVRLGSERENTKIKLLQLTDIQVIDSSQCRSAGRLREDEMHSWAPENFDALCGNHIRSLVAQTCPDLIFITGDIIYGEFDDSGRSFKHFCDFMDSFAIPWAPVWGNHDNESLIGVDRQCRMFTESKYCLFAQGEVSGNSNYTVGIAVGDTLVRVLHMLDSNGCHATSTPDQTKPAGIYDDQIDLIETNAACIRAALGKDVPAFVAFHIPTEEFEMAARSKGYTNKDPHCYTIGVDVKAVDGDFGSHYENVGATIKNPRFLQMLKSAHVDGVFAGHCHNINTCISYQGIKWVYGLKTGQYDYHMVGQLGGTLVTLEKDGFEVNHVPALVALAPYPEHAPMFEGLFV